jgi:hypothetical protein
MFGTFIPFFSWYLLFGMAGFWGVIQMIFPIFLLKRNTCLMAFIASKQNEKMIKYVVFF